MIEKVVEECSNILSGRSVVSEWEIERVARRALLRVFGSDAIGKNFDDVVKAVKNSFLNEPISVKSLHFSECFELNGEKFYHLHVCKPESDEVSLAYEEMLKSRRYIKALEEVKNLLTKFFEGYNSKDGFLQEFLGKNKYAVSVFLIEDVSEDLKHHKRIAEEYDGEYAVVTLTEKDIFPFLKFFKRHSEEVKKSGFYIWVADEERKYVDPFIGYPKDIKLWKRFKNPKAASIVNSLWRVKVEEID